MKRNTYTTLTIEKERFMTQTDRKTKALNEKE
jgi:hypothetical protein